MPLNSAKNTQKIKKFPSSCDDEIHHTRDACPNKAAYKYSPNGIFHPKV